jgi:dihydropteridine reductase
LFVVIGATAALSATPGMLGYGLAKAGTHHFIQTMGASTGKSLESKGKRKAGRRVRQCAENLDTMSVIGILPTIIDTPSNRVNNPKADFRLWTKPRDIAAEIGNWAKTPQLRPHSGSLVKISSTAEGSTFELVR